MLTHDQAAFLKSLQRNTKPYERSLENDLFGYGFTTYNLPDGSSCSPRLEEDGEAALAEYDAKYMVVERAEHRRLTSIENKIDDFLDWSMLGDNQIEFGEEGGLRVHWEGTEGYGVSGHWVVTDFATGRTWSTNQHEHCGAALREAFRVWCTKWDAAHADEPSEYVSVRREHLEELRDTANTVYESDKAIYEGRSGLLAKLEPARLAIEHADVVLRGEQ